MTTTEACRGLRRIIPVDDAPHDATIDIIAIHGLGTESPRTWEFKKRNGDGVVNWLSDADMLPAALPKARIYTYDWNANYFANAPVQTLLGHADTLLGLIAEGRGSQTRPIIFVASCFGGLILAEAIIRAAQEGSAYKHILLSTVGIVFLATPFQGSDAAKQARWQVLVKGIMGEQASDQLIKDLEQSHDFVHQRVQKFAEIANAKAVQLPLSCFFETRKTEMLRRILSPGWAKRLSRSVTRKILVTESSACLHGFPRQGLDATHSGMNKFQGPECPNFKLVKDAVRKLAGDASVVLKLRKNSTMKGHWIVRFGRNKEFVGRESILEDLLKRVLPSGDEDDCQRTAIEGLGGVGKTQIALETAYRIRDVQPECSVFWVPAVDATAFENAYRAIGQQLKVPGIDEEKADVKALIKSALGRENIGNWLLIIDNADDEKLLFGDTALADYLPFSRKGSILFTTRNHKLGLRLVESENHIIAVEEMSQDEALKLLGKNLKGSQMSDIRSNNALLEFLTNLPLAIRQASAYMAKEQISTARYLKLCNSSDEDMVKLLSSHFDDRHRYKNIQNAVATTWLISFQQISDHDALAADYLRFLCFLAGKDIPHSLLPPAGTLETVEAIGTLKAYAFISQQNESDSYDIHRLVQISMLSWLDGKGERQEWTAKVLERLDDIFPWPKHENREEWIRYLPHTQHALQLRKRTDDGEATTGLLSKVGESFRNLGKYEEAEQMHRQALQLKEKVLGKEHPATLTSMNNLAVVLRSQGKYEEAEQIHRQALQLREKVLGKEHPDTLSSMNNLAFVLHSQGKYEEAEQMHRQALQLSQKVLGKEHPHTLTSMNNLAGVLDSQGKYEEAEQMHRQALQLREKVLGKEHPDTLSSMSNLARVLGSQGKYEEAEQIHRQALQLREKVLGKEHPDTLGSMNNLASVLHSQGKYEEAEEMHRQALQLSQKVLGKEHPDTLSSMNNLAFVLDSQGKYEEAEQMHRQALQLSQKVLGKEHPHTLTSMNNLAGVLDSQGRYEEAGQMHRQELQLSQKVLGKEHPHTLISMNNLALVLYSQGKYEEAEEMHRQALQLREKVLEIR
ncbi:P-loop containing nucleoside triphosphate hydrolase protein [Podospora pseudocomata]|uniref:P-loop containing nucleoside triphosphate hydrolase protein n=1 Tax=Podospora pseudocomata TaxID=2093779 RepID=A0ABR0G7Q2_9PEZI|nr:P-loop containing nucleoside triphosphate hydrolase protein [Podospora pseudocomata]